MKAQFATVEAVVSLLFVLSLAVFCIKEAAAYAQSSFEARQGLATSIATYDLISQLMGNGTAKACAAVFAASGDSSCIAGYASAYESAYGLSSVALTIGNRTYGSMANSTVRCFPYNITGNVSIACIGVRG